MKPIIVFDLGGVLLDWNPRHLYKKIFSSSKEMEYFLSEICSPAWNEQMDSGKPFQAAVAELQEKFPGYQDQIAAYHTHWTEMVSGEIPGTVEILKEVKDAGHKIAALSNWSMETFPLIKDQYPFLKWFDPLVISGEEGVSKPDPKIYQILLEKLEAEAGNCLFIDDVEKNLIAAEKIGFGVLQFLSSENLRTELNTRGIL
jgi:2-haloacid dehalogenase